MSAHVFAQFIWALFFDFWGEKSKNGTQMNCVSAVWVWTTAQVKKTVVVWTTLKLTVVLMPTYYGRYFYT